MRRIRQRLLHRKRPLVYSVFVTVLVFFLGNEWLLVFFQQQSSSFQGNPTPQGLPPTRIGSLDSQHHHDDDGVFRYHKGLPTSYLHCVGDNFLKNAWSWKSCQFANLCWELDQEYPFTIYPPTRRNITVLSEYARSSTDPWAAHKVSTSATQPASIASQKFAWFPQIVDATAAKDDPGGYYEPVSNVVWIPMTFDPAFLARPSSVLFDILLPIYTLTTLFGWQDLAILLTPLNPSACWDDAGTPTALSCYPPELQPYLGLLHLAPLPTLPWSSSSQQEPSKQQSTTTSYHSRHRLCVRRAAAGVGALSDHGHKRHGERPADYQTATNVGKASLFFKFRRYVLHNAGIQESTTNPPIAPARVILASFTDETNPSLFTTLSSHLQQQISSNEMTLQQVNLDQLSIRQQLELAVQATFWISRVGEASIPAFFMKRHGTVILAYDSKNGRIPNSNRPAMWHWDLWNHGAAHVTVHWLPAASMESAEGLQMFQQIVQLQIDYLRQQQADDSSQTGSSTRALGHELTWILPGSPSISSAAHCLGDNFVNAQAPAYRSCHYQNLCLDVPLGQFQLVASKSQEALEQQMRQASLVDSFSVVATDLHQTVMDGRNVRFTQNEPWAPSVVEPLDDTNGYFTLPSDVLWIPYTLDASFAGNLGHFCWDFLLPFYTLLAMYGHDDDTVVGQKKRLVLTSLDDACRTDPKCSGLVGKFIPLMGVSEIYSVDHLQIQSQADRKVKRICAKHGSAGIGMLTDHGSTRHGQNLDDYQRIQNGGRGAHFYAFRNFMLRNLGIDEGLFPKRERHGVLFSVNSSTSLHRRKSFDKQIAAARDGLANDRAFVSGVELARFPLRDQIQAMLQTTVLISTVGGSTATAMFLPRHASLILYFSSDQDFVGHSRKADFPTMMDFDFWNNASYLRVHWLPTGNMDEVFHLEFLVDLVRSELAQTDHFRSLDDTR